MFVEFCVNFEQNILSREEEWCKLHYSAPEWWDGNERGEPRFMEELVMDSRLLGNYFKNWLWEMQVEKYSLIKY